MRDPADLPVAIETTRVLVVDRQQAAGHPVIRCPVTKESGKHRTVNFRCAIDHRARQTLTT